MTSRRQMLALMAAGALGGCSGIDLPWLGANKTPLPGERKPILLANDDIVADTRLTSLTVTVPSPVALAEWPQSGGSADHSLGNIAGPATLRRVGSVSIGSGGSSSSPLLSPPVIAAGKVFAIDSDGRAIALSGNGDRLWEKSLYEDTPDRLAGGGLAFDSARLFVTLSHGEVVALAADSGEELWRASFRTPLRAAPAVSNARVLVRSSDNQLLVLEQASGDVAWRHTGLFEQTGILGGGPPAVANGVVVVAYSSGEVFALQMGSGRQLWSDTVLRPRRVLATDTISDIIGAPVIDGDLAYVAGGGGEVAGFDIARGQRVWSNQLSSYGTPWVAGDFIYLVTERGELVCVLRQGGRVRWVADIKAAVGADDVPADAVWTGPVMVEGRLIVAGSNGDLLAFSPAAGELAERVEIGDGTRLPPVAADGAIYVLTDDGNIVAFR